jgi:hypothetical protein
MVGLTEREPASLRTKVLLAVYLASSLAGLAMVLWFVVVLLIYLVSGERAVQSLPVRFLFPWLAIAAVVMLVAKFALLWSCRKDRRTGTS